MKKKLIAAALAVSMIVPSFSNTASAAIFVPRPVNNGGYASAPWIIIGCAGGVVLAALAANYRDGRELTAPEAWTCGLLFLVSKPKHKRHHH